MAVNKRRTHLGEQEGLKLAGVRENLTPEQATEYLAEIKRCEDSIDYFVENYFYVLDPQGEKVKIKMFPKQRELLNMINDNRFTIALAARQTGKSCTYSMYILYEILFKRNHTILIAGNKGEIAREILAKIKDAYELLPNWLKPGLRVWNESKITFENGVVIKATTTTANAARGFTIDTLVLDEFAFVDQGIQKAFFTSAVPTISSRPKSKIIVASTPNGVGDMFHKIWKLATSGVKTEDGISWSGCRIEWYDRPDRDEKWKQTQLAILGSQEAFDIEYGNSFTVTAGNKLIPDDKIISLKEFSEKECDTYTLRNVDSTRPNFAWKYYEYFPFEYNRTYIGCADVAEGTGQDSSVFHILDITEGCNIKLCATFASAKILPSDFATVILKMCVRYKNPWVMIEANSVGVAAIDALTKTQHHYERVFKYNRKNFQPGIFSHVQTKAKACINAQKIIQSSNYSILLPDKEIFDQLSFFEKAAENKYTYKARKGHHDDHIIALIWGLLAYSEDIIEKLFTVEYRVDEETSAKIPILIVNQEDDIESIKLNLNGLPNNRRMSAEERFQLAAKWRELGDFQRADFILQTIWQDEFDETGAIWGNNPYQLDVSMFSEGLFGERYAGMGRESVKYGNIIDSGDSFGFMF